ncbi:MULTISPECIES: ABC transporter permease [unclassified Marinobacterium]|jgi:putative lysine/arginine/ornithine/histidine/octopine transport system permease protein|uniref:ABC transporter permease n=2 Tax=Marinobacterium TaxID=48075 RepID=UPI001568E596|nr:MULTISPECIES: ABC transporter permease [unclassified Marinobacterium]NRP09511.1 Octopine transport system permease protein OccM [Marinobacterium sp. xm-g-48]NRP15950.1 Octopine transport system permease protein OccM [Marinobacterium sp. xm-a-152]NRP28428.1 Octopine transport system permease protein OccM [Marinobacterium sp. xm-d-420]NRP35404.1 Octopine transport system permease protein OccM [Marinobacterium sp. xm-d-579]NRP37858.1 Octopine transport system permease protein OccM [Marinobacte
MNWSWDVIWEYFPRLFDGVWLTLELVLYSALTGLAIAVPLALMRASKNRLVSALPWAYIYFFRGTPLLVQIFLIYYGSAQFDLIRNTSLWEIFSEPFWCALIALTLNTAAYSAELVRGAIQSIPKGEIEAAEAFGMSKLVQIRRIVLPRAFGIVLPAYGNELILMLKGSALASTITLLDLTGMARTIIARTYTPLEIFFAAGMLYLAIAALFILAFRFIERWLNRYQYPR